MQSFPQEGKQKDDLTSVAVWVLDPEKALVLKAAPAASQRENKGPASLSPTPFEDI